MSTFQKWPANYIFIDLSKPTLSKTFYFSTCPVDCTSWYNDNLFFLLRTWFTNSVILIHFFYVPVHVSSTIVLIFRRGIVLVQHVVSSLSLGDCSVHRLWEDSCNLCTEQFFILNGQVVKHGNLLVVKQRPKLMTVALLPSTELQYVSLQSKRTKKQTHTCIRYSCQFQISKQI